MKVPKENKVRLATQLFGLALIWFGGLPGDVIAQEHLRASYESAQELFRRGEDDKARTAFGKLLVETYRARAILYQKQGLWAQVKNDLEAALTLQPESSQIRFDLGYTCFRLRDYPQTAKLLEPLIRPETAAPEVLGLLGRAYLSLGKLDEAQRALAAALRLAPDDVLTAYTLALVTLKKQGREGATGIFADLAKQQGSSAGFHLVVGQAYLDSGYYSDAQQELRQALERNPNTRFARYLLALALLRDRETAAFKDAQELLAKERKLFPDEFAATYLSGLLLELDRQWEPATEAFRDAAKLSPEEADVYFHLGNTELKLRRAQEAVATLRQALALSEKGNPSRFRVYRAHYLLSQAYRALGDLKSSAEEAELARKLSSDMAQQERERGMASGLRTVLEGLSAAGQSINWLELDRPAQLTSEKQGLLAAYGQVLANGNNYVGLIAVRQQNFSEAAQYFARVRDLQPDFFDIDHNLGIALFQAEQYPQALQVLERAVSQKPSDLTVRKYLGLTCCQQKDYARCAKELEEVRASRPDDPQVLLVLGTALARSNRPDAAQRVFADLLKYHPDSAPLHVLWGQAYADQNAPKEAARELRRALELDPRVASAHFYLGMMHLKKGELKEAEQEFRGELATHPHDARARYHLAFVLLTQQDFEQGIPLLRQVIRDIPSYSEAYYSLGKALFQQGQIAEAIEKLETAVRLSPEKAYSHYQLARAYQRAGRPEEAQREFQAAQNLKDQARGSSPGRGTEGAEPE
jgi:tetratricopeptide (TPR) repeat protein